jgi:hypothetical protein
MRRLVLFFLAVSIVSLQFGCSEDNGGNPVASDPTYTYGELAVFDTTAAIFSRLEYPSSGSKIPEPLVNWEQSLGEPFTDNNGNGVYDAGVDTYQDINNNDAYDGPGDPWTPGIPFDDIDGNGEFREDPGDHISGYQIGLPYADFNENSIHDGDLKAVYGVVKWVKGTWLYGLPAYYPAPADAVYRFVSDSGMVYDLPFRFTPTMNAVIVESDGLYLRLDPNPVRILSKGDIVADSAVAPKPAAPDEFTRTVTLNASINVDGVTYSDLVKVQLEDTDDQYIFYFARKRGIIAYEYLHDISATPGNWVTYTRRTEYYFRVLPASHSLVFPTTR